MTQQIQERVGDEELVAEPEIAIEGPEHAVDDSGVPPWVPRGIGVAAGIVLGVFLIGVAGGWQGSRPEAQETNPTVPVTEPAPPADTLGVVFTDFRESWNSLESRPYINDDLRRFPESGALSSFKHDFDESAYVAGAYRDRDDYVVAVMVRSSIHHPAFANMYLHVCYIVDPYSPDCIANYLEKGLNGKKISKVGQLSRKGHEASWDYRGQHWQVIIEGDVQTIRVNIPGAE